MEKCSVRSINGGNTAKRVELIRAMETLARTINDESVFNSWLVCGVPDGAIKENTPDEDLEQFTDDETLKEFMDCFLRCMTKASKSGGLFYCD